MNPLELWNSPEPRKLTRDEELERESIAKRDAEHDASYAAVQRERKAYESRLRSDLESAVEKLREAQRRVDARNGFDAIEACRDSVVNIACKLVDARRVAAIFEPSALDEGRAEEDELKSL